MKRRACVLALFGQWITGVTLMSMLLVCPQKAATQGRMTDKDVEKMMENMKEDTKKFRSSFNSAVGKSTIRKTQQEKESKAMVERFQTQTGKMLDHFKDKKNADTELSAARDSAGEIDKVLASTPMGGTVDADWSKVKTELGTLSEAFGIKTPASEGTPVK